MLGNCNNDNQIILMETNVNPAQKILIKVWGKVDRNKKSLQDEEKLTETKKSLQDEDKLTETKSHFKAQGLDLTF